MDIYKIEVTENGALKVYYYIHEFTLEKLEITLNENI